MVTNVSSLLKTVRSVEDEAQRGIRAIESTVDAVKQAVVVCIAIIYAVTRVKLRHGLFSVENLRKDLIFRE